MVGDEKVGCGERVGLSGILRSMFWGRKSSMDRSSQLIISRHGERIDSMFGPQWLSMAFESWPGRRYNRFHSNMPSALPLRPSINDFVNDSPITANGHNTAKMIGRLLLRNHKDVVECYSSPALRSIQTADSMLEGMNKKHLVPIKIEPALFECYSWYNGQLVNFMNLRDLTLNGFNIDRFYTPTINFVSPNESELDYYNRSAIFVQRLETTGKTNRGILVLGHAATPEVLSRALLKQPPRPKALLGLAAKVDFADLSIMEKEHATGKWKFKNSIL